MRLFDLTGKTALITGSTRGIGKAIAWAMAEHGAKVVISSRKEDVCEAVVGELTAAGHTAVSVPANISHESERDALVDQTEAKLGPVDVLVCNAAVNPHYGPLLDVEDDAFDKTIAVNVRANMKLAARVVPGMQDRRDGVIIIVSSIAAFKGTAHLGLYALTKAADVQLVRNLACEFGKDNIRVNGLAPAVVKTEFARKLWEEPKRAERTAQSYALKRLGEPDDIAGAAVFLASRAGAWMTGQTLIIDGGWSAMG